jgi:deazaflavin-dependent oxidoreductase (nitroreductase family)
MNAFQIITGIHIGLYKATGGAIGGSMAGGKILLLTTKGRKTGKERTVPVMFIEDDAGHPVVCASKAGAPENPLWFENLKATPAVTYQIGSKTTAASAEIAGPELRDQLWKKLTAKYPNFLSYEKKTTRVIPMVTLKPAAN